MAAEQRGSTVGMSCLGLQLHNHFGGEGSAPSLSLLQVGILLYLLVPGLILVQFTTHQEPIQLKTNLFSQVSSLQQARFSATHTAQPCYH